MATLFKQSPLSTLSRNIDVYVGDVGGGGASIVSVRLKPTQTYDELLQKLRKTALLRGGDAADEALYSAHLHVVARKAPHGVIGCLSDVSDDMSPFEVDQQMRDEKVDFVYVLRPRAAAAAADDTSSLSSADDSSSRSSLSTSDSDDDDDDDDGAATVTASDATTSAAVSPARRAARARLDAKHTAHASGLAAARSGKDALTKKIEKEREKARRKEAMVRAEAARARAAAARARAAQVASALESESTKVAREAAARPSSLELNAPPPPPRRRVYASGDGGSDLTTEESASESTARANGSARAALYYDSSAVVRLLAANQSPVTAVAPPPRALSASPTRPDGVRPFQETPFYLGGSDVCSPVPLGVGCWAWGNRDVWHYGESGEYGEKECREAFVAALEAGVSLFDTAEVYGDGLSESLLGDFVDERGDGVTPRVVLASKFMPHLSYLSTATLRTQLLASLERLGRKQLDLYQLHGVLTSVRSVEAWADALADAVKEGLVRAVGVSNLSLSQLERAYFALRRRGVPLASLQVEYSLLRRAPEFSGLLARCAELNVAVIAYSPLAMGRLTGKYDAQLNPPPAERHFGAADMRAAAQLLAALKAIATRRRKTMPQVALNWCICKGALPVAGAKNGAQARDNAGALGWRLSDAEVGQLDQLSLSCQSKQSFLLSLWQD